MESTDIRHIGRETVAELKNRLTFPRIVLELAQKGQVDAENCAQAISYLDESIHLVAERLRPLMGQT